MTLGGGDKEFHVVGGDGTKLQCEAPDHSAREAWVKAIMQNILALRAAA